MAQDLSPIACIPGTLFSRSLAVPSSWRPQITGNSDRDTHGRITNALEGPPTTSQGREAAQSTSLPELAYKIVLKPPAVTISEVLSGIITFLYAFFACAVVASRRRAGRWSSPPAPRRARAPAASTPHAHEAIARFGRPFSGRSFLSACFALRRAPRRLLSKLCRASTHGRPTNERCDERSAGVADWNTARRGNTERTLTAAATPPPRDPYRHSLAMRPPQKARPFVSLTTIFIIIIIIILITLDYVLIIITSARNGRHKNPMMRTSYTTCVS